MKLVWKRTIAISLAVIIILGIIAMILLVPRKVGNQADEIWIDESSFDINNIQTLTKKSGEDFNILAITDTQFDDPFKSKKQIKDDLAQLVKIVNPDLIVTVGDNFAGIFNHFHVDAFVDMMDDLGVMWAPIFGNHERDFGADLYYLSKIMQKSKLCMFKTGPTNIDGVGNYIINIEEDENLAFSLVMMDCNEEYFVKDKNGKIIDSFYESPRHSQVGWYEDNIKSLAKHAGKTIPSILFTHTPLPEFKQAYDLYKQESTEVKHVAGEGEVGGGRINYGLFDTALRLGSTKHMFFGHEHTNTLALEYKGINLAYAVKTGNFSSYDQGKTGGTAIKLRNNGIIEYSQLYSAELS